MVGFFLLRYSSKEIIDSSEKKLIHASALVGLKFSGYIEALKHDITHLSKSPFLSNYLESESRKDRELLTQEYLSLIESKPDFAQIRFIGVGNDGKELIRVERKNNQLFFIPDDELQEKGTRDYFIETIKMAGDSLYISNVNLNREYGKISLPHMPTLRVAFPVYTNSDLKGIIVINTDLSKLFESLNRFVDQQASLRIINNQGHYVLHENSDLAFGFEFENPPLFQSEFGMSPRKLRQSHNEVFEVNGMLYMINELPFPKENYQLFSLVLADRRILLQSYFEWRKNSFIILISLGLTFMFLAFFYMNRQTKKLKEITNKIKIFPQTLKVSNLPVNRKDEIGALARTFNEMSTLISNNMKSLEKAKADAEEAVKEKEEFLENMSHEIRNPLQSIIGLCNVLENNNPAPHQLKIIKNLNFNTSNLHSLVNDILDYKKLLRGDITLQNDWNAVNLFMEEIHGSNNYFAVSKKLKLTQETWPQLIDKEFFIDKTRLSQIINNLLMNAIKFTPQGGKVAFKATLQQQKKEQSVIRFSIADTGIGIAPDLIKKIKERYFTQQQKVAFSDGFGLGLSIVIQLLNYLDSELMIESREGKGSLFYFDIKTRLRDLSKDNQIQKSKEDLSILSDFSMLVIDDDKQIISLYKHLFSDFVNVFKGFPDVASVSLEESPIFDIIITDYKLADKTIEEGFDTLQKICASNPIFYIVSAVSKKEKEIISPIKITRHLRKPFDVDKLKQMLYDDVLELLYGRPDLSSIMQDYDFDKVKYAHAIALLISEWKSISNRLPKVIEQNHAESFYNITHKMITTVRRLKLDKFEYILEEIRHDFSKELSTTHSKKIEQAMKYYIRCIEVSE